MIIKLYPDIMSTLEAVLGPLAPMKSCGCREGNMTSRICGCDKWNFRFISSDKYNNYLVTNWCFCPCHKVGE